MLADLLCGTTCTFPVPHNLPREAEAGKYAESIWITMDDRKKAVSSSLFVLKIAFIGIILGDYLKIRKFPQFVPAYSCSIGYICVFQQISPTISALFSKSLGNIPICEFFTQLTSISGLVIGVFLKIRKILPIHFHIFIRDLGTFLDH